MIKKQRKKTENIGFIDIYGIHAVLAALKNKNRKHRFLTISSSNRELITKEIKNKVKKINILDNKQIRKLYGNENVHQGIILNTAILQQIKIEDVIVKTKNKESEIK